MKSHISLVINLWL